MKEKTNYNFLKQNLYLLLLFGRNTQNYGSNQFCGEELARHFGDCDGYMISDAAVDGRLKEKKKV